MIANFRRPRTVARAAVAVLTASALVTGCSPSGSGAESTADGLDVIRLLQAGDTSMSLNVKFVGDELGYFEDAGITVEEQDAGDMAEAAFLSSGRTDIAYTGVTEILTGIGSGVDLDIIYEYWHSAAEGVFVLDDSPIQSASELPGNRIGLASESDAQFLSVVLDSVGISPDQVDTVIVGDQGGVVAKALQDGTIAAVSGSTGEQRSLAGAGVQVRDITPAGVLETAGQTFVATPETMDAKADVFERFFRAWAKASYASMVDDEVLLKMGDRNIPEATLDRAQALVGVEQAHKAEPVDGTFGELRPEVWDRVNLALVRAGGLQEPVDLAGHLDDRFIEAANDFDRAEVEADVKAWANEHM